MKTADIISSDKGVLRLSGSINYQSTPKLWKKCQQHLDSVHTLDLSEVTQTDSAAAALLISISRYAKDNLVIKNIPAQLIALLDVCNLREVLPLYEV